ncbi:putative UDP-N-acetylglucosamine pyrophosphorylase [Exidia glandulosa HHB12029]|uniref:UDP-N-acetylglucosamine diphosphorylase n=1 Tax=Exidia glandulosa HHB12029 TaxID=1314781 RepID=A0A165NAM9_EXIGL|nr:putative UDP-N-acetylglucosamine pyrophosphorylase [Exidia glandulosa HHB12029]
MTADIAALRKKYEHAGQGHLFAFWDKLSAQEKDELAEQLAALDVDRVNRIYHKAVSSDSPVEPSVPREPIAPLPDDAFDSTLDASPEQIAQWRDTGLRAIARGEVGVLLMAGGQGTRLGSSAPKGCYDIGLPSHKSLFELQAQRIASLQRLAAQLADGKPAVIPWYIMTSGPTRPETVAFFEKHQFFGLQPDNVIFFEQGTLPCLSMDGKILLETHSRVAVAPSGNGGLYAALREPLSPSHPTHTVMSDLKDRKIQFLHTYGVDNCLVRVADPVFLGSCITKSCDCGAKVVRKTSPTESVGVVVCRGTSSPPKYEVVEYSEISSEDAHRKDAKKPNELAFRAANIVNHFYATSFLSAEESFEDQMAFHIARKKIPCIDTASGEALKPSKPNGMKLELFVFDVFPFAQQFNCLEVAREDEFSPLKNAPGTGSDDPETSRRDLLAQHKRWLVAAGAKVADGVEVEISPLVSYAGEGLESLSGKTLSKSGHVEKLDDFALLA